MYTKDKEIFTEDQLEAGRNRLNEAIVRNDFNLLAPEVIKLSCELDVIVLDEMRRVV